MNKLMYRFVTTRKKKKKKEIDPFLDTVCPLRASRVKKEIDPFLDTVCPFRASRVKTKGNFQLGLPLRSPSKKSFFSVDHF